MKTAAALGVVAMALGACGTLATRRPPTATVESEAGIAASALSMLGQPYRYGGALPGGFDCSGLVVYATARAGLQLPRTAEDQMHAGRAIPRRELRAGDLVFLHLARKELHVGIALDESRFVHAPSTGGHVRIDSLDAPPYARGFIEARRVTAAGAAP